MSMVTIFTLMGRKTSLLLYGVLLAATPSLVSAVTIPVTNTNDSGTGSLRQAILDSNASSGVLDTIIFSIPGAGLQTIAPGSALPSITDPVIIDGYTQPGSSPNTNGSGVGDNAVLLIQLNGANAGIVDGLTISAGNSNVRGLVINGFPRSPGGGGGRGIVVQTAGGTGISADGQVAVGHDGIANESRAYRWTPNESISVLPMLPGALRSYSTALAVSPDGSTIAGQAAAPPADDGPDTIVAVVWKPAVVTAKTLKGAETRTYAESETGPQFEAIEIGLFGGGIYSLATALSARGRVLVRAIGPSLSSSGVSGPLPDTTLELHDGNGDLLASNDNWKEAQRTEIEATTIPPSNDLESAIVQILPPGNYTAIVRGKGNATGVGLVEVYALP